MYTILKSIDIDFSHHVHGHRGACINLHGHTWKFEVGLAAKTLDEEGFVIDFKLLKQRVLEPCHTLLDHALAVASDTYKQIEDELSGIGRTFLETRRPIHGRTDTSSPVSVQLHGAETRLPGGMKVAVFPFAPTSERLARWLYELADASLSDDRVQVTYGRVYETLHPVASVAEWRP